MAKRFYVFILRGTCDPDDSDAMVFDTSEEVQAFLLKNGVEVDANPDNVFIIHGERFGYQADRVPVAFRLTGPSG